jgi:pimeloyl-ACP methyl ester carboxylesterase
MTTFELSGRFFGDPASALFGVYHAGQGSIIRDCGVLLCYPAPQEYSIAYWSMRQLADRLAHAGFPALRFDYFGTGDSAGSSSDVSLARWVDDVEVAAEELRRASGVRRICIVGLRLGAALAVRAVARGLSVRDLVLWDPVLNGASYVSLMRSVDERVHQSRHYPVSDSHPPGELFGYPFSAVLEAATTAVDLLREPLGHPRRLLIVSPHDGGAHAPLLERAVREGLNASQEIVDDPIPYGPAIDPVETLFAHQGIKAIAGWLEAR